MVVVLGLLSQPVLFLVCLDMLQQLSFAVSVHRQILLFLFFAGGMSQRILVAARSGYFL